MQEQAGTQRWVSACSFSSCERLLASSARCWRLPPGILEQFFSENFEGGELRNGILPLLSNRKRYGSCLGLGLIKQLSAKN